ncbi:sodium- and chloride-dependent glycine transporter 1-like isoform X2 [Ctenocephalides felis]|nr:sodium- and chloride-dependent glycine transporter 1-like isoform X2 [Ctenocephalides felis]
MMLVIGLPTFFLEMSIGQYSGLGPIKSFAAISPIFGGTGYAVLAVITLVTIYYEVIVAWILFYIFASFSSELKWGSCRNSFNTMDCYSVTEDKECRSWTNGSYTFYQKACTPVKDICDKFNLSYGDGMHCRNGSQSFHLSTIVTRTLAAEEYYYNYVLGRYDHTWEDWGAPSWQLLLCLALGWIITCLCLLKGINNAGYVLYVTIFSPYIVLVALLIRGATLDGALEGIKFYITPDFSALKSPDVWGDAASQIFYSFGIACGSLVTLSSYNPFSNNCHRDAVYVSVLNVLTAIFAGFVVFSITGFLAHEMGVPLSEVAEHGPGLAFVAYPEAVNMMPIPQLWSVLFFLMMLALGLSSQFGGLETINTCIIDQWPQLRAHRWKVTVTTCTVCFILGIPMVCGGGVYLFTLMDWNTASWAVLLIGMAQLVLVSWSYGMNKYLDNIAEMGIKLNRFAKWYWKVTIAVISPLACLAVFIFLMINYETATFEDYIFPAWADAIGILIGLTTLVPIPIYTMYLLFKRKITGWDLFKPTKAWGPQTDVNRRASLLVARTDGEQNTKEV